jgi:uncharacterized protein
MSTTMAKESPMTTRDEPWPQGTPCWIDGMVPDLQVGRDFYAGLFGWEMVDTGPESGGYTIARLSGRPVAGIGEPPPDNEMPPVWTTYIAVDDVDAIAARARELGGKVFMEPMDVMDEGRMAIVADPTGAVFGLWQQRNHRGAEIYNEPGALTWNECMTRDYSRAGKFYTDLFGYTADEVGDDGMKYSVLYLDGSPIGGLGELGADMPADIPPHWMSYFAVADADDTVKRASELGGQVRMPPMDTPYGRLAVLAGPQGEVFAVIAG